MDLFKLAEMMTITITPPQFLQFESYYGHTGIRVPPSPPPPLHFSNDHVSDKKASTQVGQIELLDFCSTAGENIEGRDLSPTPFGWNWSCMLLKMFLNRELGHLERWMFENNFKNLFLCPRRRSLEGALCVAPVRPSVPRYWLSAQ